MRRSLLLLLFMVPLLAAPAAAGEPTSLMVVVRADADGVEVVSARPSDRAPDPEPVVMELSTLRTRWADSRTPDGGLVGGPLLLDGSHVRLFLPLGTDTLSVRVDGQLQALAVPSADDERGGEEEPEPEVFTIQWSGVIGERQDIVFLSEGYLEDQRQSFLADVRANLDYLETLEPYDRYLPLINVYALFLPSDEEGADHLETQPQSFADTALNCEFGAYGIAHLLDCDLNRVLNLASNAPADDVRVVLVNDPAYGGSGGPDFAVASTHEEMPRLVAHEMGHSDGELADEYDGGYGSGGAQVESPNCHWEDTGLPWDHWIEADSPGVDAFPVCWYTDYFRPTDDACMMRTLQDTFCVVCREQLARTILYHVDSLVVGIDPADGVVEEPIPWDGEVTLSVDLLEVNGEGLTVIWDWVEGDEELARGPNLDTLVIGGLDLERGVQTVRVRVQDRINWILEDVPWAMVFEADFQVEFLDSGGDDDDDDDDDDGGSGCTSGGEGGCGGDDDDDGGGFSRTALPLAIPALLLGLRRRRSYS